MFHVRPNKRRKMSDEQSSSMKNSIPAHVINSTDKRRQRKIFKTLLQRAGLFSNRTSLSCIEKEDEGSFVSLKQPDEQHHQRNKQQHQQRYDRHHRVQPQPVHSASKTNLLWLGAASQKIITEIELSHKNDAYKSSSDTKIKLDKNAPVRKESRVQAGKLTSRQKLKNNDSKHHTSRGRGKTGVCRH